LGYVGQVTSWYSYCSWDKWPMLLHVTVTALWDNVTGLLHVTLTPLEISWPGYFMLQLLFLG